MSQTAAAGANDVRRGIEEADRRFMEAFNAGDVEGAARGVYTEDAQVLPPGGETVQGRENIIQFWKATAEQLGVERVELSSVDVQPVGELAYQVGRAMLTMRGGERAEGKYVVIWKQENGQWKWHIDIFNFNA
jgi:uncharacterized protein (TIGR02246 family)